MGVDKPISRFSLRRRRVPVYLQTAPGDCGCTALKMIVDYYRGTRTVTFNASALKRGASLRQLADLADRSGLQARAVRAETTELRHLRTPAMLHWCPDHFVVLIKVRRGRCLIHDPARGRRWVGRDRVDLRFSGVALELAPAVHFSPSRTRRSPGLWDFAASFPGLGRYLALMLGLMFSAQVLGLASAVATQLLIDEVALAGDRAWLLRVLGGLALVLLTASILEAWRQRFAIEAAARFQLDGGLALMRHLFTLPTGYFRRRQPGDVLSRLASLGAIRTALSEDLAGTVVQFTVLLTTLVAMYLYQPLLASVSVAGALCAGACEAATLPARRRLGNELVAHQASEDSSVLGTLRNLEIIRGFDLMAIRLRQWQRYAGDAVNAAARRGLYVVYAGFLRGAFGTVEQVLFLGIGLSAVAERRTTLGVLFAFMALRARFGSALSQLLTIGCRLYLLRTHQERVSDIIFAEPERTRSTIGLRRSIEGKIQVNQLAFAYDGQAPLFHQLDLCVRAREHVAITGKSGSGKSTLLTLIAGRAGPTDGEVLLDGVELDLWHPDTLRRGIVTVAQRDTLLDGSIAENLSGFSEAPDWERIREIAEAVEVWPLIRQLPMGLHTPVSTLVLSGGETQRLVIARALYCRPRVLLLDEATASLDAASESIVLNAVSATKATVLHVTHRPGGIRRADRCVRLEHRGLHPASASGT